MKLSTNKKISKIAPAMVGLAVLSVGSAALADRRFGDQERRYDAFMSNQQKAISALSRARNGATPSDRAQGARLQQYFEAEAIYDLADAAASPVRNERDAINEIREIYRSSPELSQGFYDSAINILREAAVRDINAAQDDARPRDLELMLRDLDEQAQDSRMGGIYAAARDTIGIRLTNMVALRICAMDDIDLRDDASRYKDRADASRSTELRSVYANLAAMLQAEYDNRHPVAPPAPPTAPGASPAPAPVAPPAVRCTSPRSFVVQAESGPSRYDVMSVGVLLEGRRETGLRADLAINPAIEEIRAEVLGMSANTISVQSNGRSRVVLRAVEPIRLDPRNPLRIRLMGLDRNYNRVAEVMLPLYVHNERPMTRQPEEPRPAGMAVSANQLSLNRNQQATVSAFVVDNYGIAMTGASIDGVEVVSGQERVKAERTGDGKLLVTAMHSFIGRQEPTQIRVSSNTSGASGRPQTISVSVTNPKPERLNYNEALKVTDWLYAAIYYRADGAHERDPGVASWAQKINGRGQNTIEDVAYEMIRSQPFRQILAGTGRGEDDQTQPGPKRPEDIVTRFYQKLLGRNPDPEGMSQYVRKGQKGLWRDISGPMIDSEEFRERLYNEVIGK